MQQFSCTQCGKCCKADPSTNEEYFHIRLFDFEMKALKSLADEKEIVYEPAQYITDSVSGKNLVIFYKLKSKDCPFLVDNLCSIYEKRPILCRAFPVITSGRSEIPEVVTSGLCPGNQTIKKDLKEPTIKEFSTIYHKNYFSCYLFEEIIKQQKALIQNLIKEGKIVPIERNSQLEFIDMSDYFAQNAIEFDITKIEEDIKAILHD